MYCRLNAHVDDANQDNVYEYVQFLCVRVDVNVSDFCYPHHHEYGYDVHHHDYADEYELYLYGNGHAHVLLYLKILSQVPILKMKSELSNL